MALFDDWLYSQNKNPIYVGNPPTDEADYKDRVSWSCFTRSFRQAATSVFF